MSSSLSSVIAPNSGRLHSTSMVFLSLPSLSSKGWFLCQDGIHGAGSRAPPVNLATMSLIVKYRPAYLSLLLTQCLSHASAMPIAVFSAFCGCCVSNLENHFIAVCVSWSVGTGTEGHEACEWGAVLQELAEQSEDTGEDQPGADRAQAGLGVRERLCSAY